MSIQELKEITRQFVIEPWGNGNLAVLDRVCAPNYRMGDNATLQDLKDTILQVRNVVSNLQVTIGEMVTDGERIACFWTLQGTHGGEFDGIPPTGKPVTFRRISILRFADGKIVHDRFESSSPGLREQIS